MCGRYILVQKPELLEKRFNATFLDKEAYAPSYNIAPGQMAAVITDKLPHKIQLFRFGLTPFWAEKQMTLINARTEGDHNKDNSPLYSGIKGIISKPAFRKPIRSQRCLVLADAFIEGTEKNGLDEPYVVYVQGIKPFAFAGIWDEWRNPKTDEIIHSFAIITTTANDLLLKIPHHRSPVILTQYQETKWLRERTSLSGVTQMLQTYPTEAMNAYPISKEIKALKNNALNFIQPIGERLQSETEVQIKKTIQLHGMGMYKDKKRDN